MDFYKLLTRYKQFGELQLVWEYAKLGILQVAVKSFFCCIIKRQSFKAIYPGVLKRIEPFLIEKFQVSRFKIQDNELSHDHPRIIWWCWLQGKKQAPPVVQACYNSLKKNLPEYEINVIDAENWNEYVELPEYILKKWEKKQIPPALFSDLLRLELLIKYGGTWIDSTVLCTGVKKFKSSSGSNRSTSSPTVLEFKKYMEADLFLFQYTKPGSIPVSISNWFISACSNNEVLIVLREMLYAYWKDYDCVLDYYIFHLFFAVISKEYPEQILAMPYGQSQNSLVLLYHWGEKFEQKKWDKLTSQVCFHKLAFRVEKALTENPDNYYSKIISKYGNI